MKFYYPNILFFLFFIPFLLIIGINGIKSKTLRKYKFINNEIPKKLRFPDNILLNKISLYLWITMFILIIIAFARPQGNPTFGNNEEQGRDIVIAVDISESMKAEDIYFYEQYENNYTKNRTRLDAAKKQISNFIGFLNGDRVSLVAFSETAFPLVPLSNDYNFFTGFLNNLNFSYNEEGGTNIEDAIGVSIKRFSKKEDLSSRIIIIFSDGESDFNNKSQIISEVKNKKIKIFTVGIGTKEGSKIPEGKDIFGNTAYKTYIGKEIITKLDEKNLNEIATLTGGKFFLLNDHDISRDLFKEISKIEPNIYKTSNNKQNKEYFQIFLILIIIIFIIDLLLPYFMKDTYVN